MKLLFLLAGLAAAVLADDAAAITSCPTITRNVPCSTCVMPECMAISTMTNPCGCPKEVPTSLAKFDCKADKPCPGGCAGTTWSVLSETRCPRSTSCPTITHTVRAPDCTPPPHPGAKVCQELKCLSQIPVTIPCGTCNEKPVPTTTVTGPCTCQSGCATISAAVRLPCPMTSHAV